MWMTSCTGNVGWGFLGLVKKQWVEFLRRNGKVDFRGLPRLDQSLADGVPHVVWGICKSSQHRKIVSLSPHVEKPLNSKRWIKVLYLHQFRECRVFRIPYVYFTHPYTMGMLQKQPMTLMVCLSPPPTRKSMNRRMLDYAGHLLT